MKLFFHFITILLIICSSAAQEKPQLSMQGGRVYFEIATGSQRAVPDLESQWSFRIGAGANALFGNFYTSGKYSIAGIRHIRDEDIPQSLVSSLRFGGGWMFQDRFAQWSFAPILSAGHTSDRIMPETGRTELQFDGWGITPGIEARYVVYSSFNPGKPHHSSAFWGTHFIQFEMHRILSSRAYTVASLSYNMVFDGFQLVFNTEYNSIQQGARGWVFGIELGFSWFGYKAR